jgi:hypothetical protein
MNGWVILIVFDGPMNIDVYGPYDTKEEAERHSTIFPRRGASYSVYVAPLQTT